MGSSGGSRLGGGARGGSSDRVSSCQDVSIEALLASPQQPALSKVAVGTIIQIKLDTSSARPIVKVWLDDEVLGSLTVTGLDKLIECLRQGYPFHGIAREVSGALCRIWVCSGKAPPLHIWACCSDPDDRRPGPRCGLARRRSLRTRDRNALTSVGTAPAVGVNSTFRRSRTHHEHPTSEHRRRGRRRPPGHRRRGTASAVARGPRDDRAIDPLRHHVA